MSRARAYRLVRRGAKGLAPVIGAVAFAVAANGAPVLAETVHTDLLDSAQPCFIPSFGTEETVSRLERLGWVEETDRSDLPKDTRNALTWAVFLRDGVPDGLSIPLDELVETMFERSRDIAMIAATKDDTPYSRNRVLIRRGEGETDILLLSVLRQTEHIQSHNCLVAAGPTAAETLLRAVDAQIGPIAAVEQLSFRVPLELTSPDALDAQARLGFVNPDVLKHVPSEYGSQAAVVLKSSISFQVEEN